MPTTTPGMTMADRHRRIVAVTYARGRRTVAAKPGHCRRTSASLVGRRARRAPVLVTCALLVVCAALLPDSRAWAQGFTTESLESAEGYYQLSWEASGPIRLIESETPDFAAARTVYSGADTARVVSGRPDGRWFYRLEDVASGQPIGDPIAVTVAHHPLDRAIAFFTVGAVVFVATLILIFAGSRAVSARAGDQDD
jgi:hypothetical protein